MSITIPSGVIYVGNFVHCPEPYNVEFLLDCCCVVAASGLIEAFGPLNLSSNFPDYEVIHLERHEFMIPGFIDTHTHAPQYLNLGLGLQYELLDWLDKVTFPTESSFGQDDNETLQQHTDRIFNVYQGMVKEYLRNGTTTCCYFGTIHLSANLELAKAVLDCGQRAFVGKVCMDQNSPDFYCETTNQSLIDTEVFIQTVKAFNSDLVQPIITPRFAITCSRELMKGLSQLAQKYDLNIQTHLSESLGEISFTQSLFPECKDYTDAYDTYGLLGPKTVLAHCIHLSDQEQETIKRTRSSISHCPNSNFALSSGIMPLKSYLDKDLKVGLGTDVSGGYSISMLDSIRQCLIASKAISFEIKSESASIEEAFYLATLGGAQALAIERKVGNFEAGKYFDALIIAPRRSTTGSLSNDFERFILTGDDRDIKSVLVNGRQINF